MLKNAEAAINAGLNVAGEYLIRVGQRLIKVKEDTAHREQGFVAWCNSGALPFQYDRALQYMDVARECGSGKVDSNPFLSAQGPGHMALSRLAKLKDEDVKQALLEKGLD